MRRFGAPLLPKKPEPHLKITERVNRYYANPCILRSWWTVEQALSVYDLVQLLIWNERSTKSAIVNMKRRMY